MGGQDAALLTEAVRRVAAVLAAYRIYLYGSRARGDATDDSDYDLMVVVRDDAERPHRAEQRALRELADIDLPIHVMVMARARFESQRNVAASLPAAVERDGQLLYAA